ncbi:MAG TPA: TonB-dependent receptor [Gammaproteobacteria bacterium]|nr:TonB-dependent receptor [Gammaproteobacteria bacterium]
MKLRRLYIGITTALSDLGAAAAQNAPNSGPGGSVEEVVVTGARLEQSLPQDLASVGNRLTVITDDQIRNGGYNDVSQVLQTLVPGLYLSPKQGPFDYVDAALQGSRTNEILWLVDGVRVSNRLYNSVTPFDTLPAHMIERIEILEGGQGLFYGTQAVSGVVNVITKGFTEENQGEIGLGTDSHDGEHINAFFRGAIDANDKFVLFASSDQSQGYQPFPDEDYQPSITDRHRGYDVTTIGGKFSHDFTDGLRLALGYQRIDADLDQDAPDTYLDAFNERQEDIFTGTLDFAASDTVQFYVKSYFHQWDSYWTEYDVDLDNPGDVVLIDHEAFWGFKDYGLNALAKLSPGDAVEYYVGYDYQKYSGRDDVLLIAPNKESVHAVFGQVRTTPELFDKARIAFGVRRNMPSESAAETVWNASGQYDFSQRLFARATVGTSFRLPDAYELFAVDTTCCLGNPNLKPESSENYNVSLGGLLGDNSMMNWEVVYFRRYVKDLIVDVDLDDGSGLTQAQNVDNEVRVRGEQVVLGFRPSDTISASVSYTHNDSEALNSNTTSGGYTEIPGIPKDQLAASLNYEPTGKPFGLTLTLNDVGSVFDIVGGVGPVARGDYTVVDVAARLYLDDSQRHKVMFRIENAFDETYTTRYRRSTVDGSTPPVRYAARNLGMPRTLHVSYVHSF